jgi:hypothetical protein
MHLDPVAAIFQRIVDAHRFARQFPRLAQHDLALFQGVRQCRRDNEAARLDARDQVKTVRIDQRYHPVDGLAKGHSEHLCKQWLAFPQPSDNLQRRRETQ